MSQRDQIRMSDAELAEFIEQSTVVTVATIGPTGRPHLMPLWYCVQDGRIAAATYGSSQKIRNLERLPEATLQIEAGESYDQLRGAMMQCDVTLVRDLEAVTAIGLAVAVRYAPGDLSADDAPEPMRAAILKQAPKRVGVVFTPTRTVSWDHRKLAAAG